jgi:hypothetical protein
MLGDPPGHVVDHGITRVRTTPESVVAVSRSPTAQNCLIEYLLGVSGYIAERWGDATGSRSALLAFTAQSEPCLCQAASSGLCLRAPRRPVACRVGRS